MAEPPFYRCLDCYGDLFVLAPTRHGFVAVCRACADSYICDENGTMFLLRRGIHDTRSLAMSATET